MQSDDSASTEFTGLIPPCSRRSKNKGVLSQDFPIPKDEVETYLSRPDFLASWEGIHRHYGQMIGASFGEAYLMRNPVPITNPMTLLASRPGVM